MLKILTLARDLRRRRAREDRGLFTIEGIRASEEALASPVQVEGALVSERLATTPRGAELRRAIAAAGIECADVSDAELSTAAETEQPQGVVLVARIPTWSATELAATGAVRWLVVDAIQDPGNLGTILRTAAALGTDAVVLMPGTVDPWNGKVVRSAMGALFRRPTLTMGAEALGELLRSTETPLWVADAGGRPAGDEPPPSRLALAVGNEGAGVSPAVRVLATRTVALPIASDVESLNVAVATGILLYLLRP